MSGSKEYFTLVTVILLQLASLLSGQVNFDLNEVIKSKCSDDGWSLIDSETITNPARLIPAKLLKASSFSCASFQINLTHSGSLDISVYVDSFSAHSGLVIIVDDGVNSRLTDYEYLMTNEDFEQGWHTISLPIEKRLLNAEVTLLGFSDSEDIVLIDSIQYKQNLKLQEEWTKTYAETKIINLIPNEYIDKIVRNPDNDMSSITQEKSNENGFDLSEVSLKQKSGEIQLIEIDNLKRTDNNEANYSENSINEQLKRSVSNLDDGNDEDGNEGNINGEADNALDNDGDDENGEGGNGENGNGEGNSQGGTDNREEENGEDTNENGNGEADNREDDNGENGNGESDGENGNGNGEDGNGEDNSANGNGEDGNNNGENGNVEDSTENRNSEEDNGDGEIEDGNGNGEDGNGEDNGDGNGEDGNEDGDTGENGNGEGDGEDGNGNGDDGNGEDNGDGNGEDGYGNGDNGENGNGEGGNGENGNGENESAETSQPDTSFWNTWTILLISAGSATAVGLVLAAAYHLGKVRGRQIPPPIDLSDLEAPRIIPRVTSARPAYERFGGSEYGGSNPEPFAR